ncbi:MAG: DUF1624 domain-containing protein [Sphingobacteriales bacterium]|nr:MAG: DUF1624 domain-containing protein [Sphingobacteriales bacterium]
MKQRIHSIDIVRGIVMIIMALDHTRELLHFSALSQNPTDLSVTTPSIFLARWITHLCAPTFVLLSGVSVYLSLQREGRAGNTKSFLRKRGLWLILLEITLVNFAIWFDVQFRIVMFQVIAAIGIGFIVLSLLLKTAPKKIGIAALSIILLHNLLQFVPIPSNPLLASLSNVLFAPGIIPVSPDFAILISYPFVQWTAIMLLGFSIGKIFEQDNAVVNKKLINYAIICFAGFLLLRFINLYSDPAPWHNQNDGLFTLFSFINVTKYPPSLQFILLFLGIAFLLLRCANALPSFLKNILLVYGKVPMFYYLLHFYIIRLATFIMVFAQGFSYSDLLFGPFQMGRPASGSGIGIVAVAGVWILIVALLYPLCKWYGKYKSNHPEKQWLRYL